MAVKDEQPSAKVTMNFHTDIPKYVHEALFLPGYYEDAIKCVFHQTSFILHHSSFILHPSSFIFHPSFFLPSSFVLSAFLHPSHPLSSAFIFHFSLIFF